MPDVVKSARLSYEGAMRVLKAAMYKATDMGLPRCIAVIEASGLLLAFVRMDGGKFLSIRTSIRKAMTAASGRAPTGSRDANHAATSGLVSEGRLTNLKAGILIAIEDEAIGAVGVSSESGEQDLEVALAGIAALVDAKPLAHAPSVSSGRPLVANTISVGAGRFLTPEGRDEFRA